MHGAWSSDSNPASGSAKRGLPGAAPGFANAASRHALRQWSRGGQHAAGLFLRTRSHRGPGGSVECFPVAVSVLFLCVFQLVTACHSLNDTKFE